ncbi:hypothetical protein [Paraflavitalea speifideaquila]|uniref:hypothetical protein n=1 Tax=Paraflavitalea speifideaquila TaxID=3076558 RepID=UPI0028E69C3C|nr:hypothetical protein [Paraflavitalea speifideiaquila]
MYIDLSPYTLQISRIIFANVLIAKGIRSFTRFRSMALSLRNDRFMVANFISAGGAAGLTVSTLGGAMAAALFSALLFLLALPPLGLVAAARF